jgi:hypothetical protein
MNIDNIKKYKQKEKNSKNRVDAIMIGWVSVQKQFV